MSIADNLGLFKPFTTRMAKARKQQIIDAFLTKGYHVSPTGFTARIIVAHCIENNIGFEVLWIPRGHGEMDSYTVRLT